MEYFVKLLNLNRKIKVIKNIEEFCKDSINIVDIVSLSIGDFEFG